MVEKHLEVNHDHLSWDKTGSSHGPITRREFRSLLRFSLPSCMNSEVGISLFDPVFLSFENARDVEFLILPPVLQTARLLSLNLFWKKGSIMEALLESSLPSIKTVRLSSHWISDPPFRPLNSKVVTPSWSPNISDQH